MFVVGIAPLVELVPFLEGHAGIVVQVYVDFAAGNDTAQIQREPRLCGTFDLLCHDGRPVSHSKMDKGKFPPDDSISNNIPADLSQAFSHLFLTHFPDYGKFNAGVHRHRETPETEAAVQSEDLSKIARFEKQIGFGADHVSGFEIEFPVPECDLVVHPVYVVRGVLGYEKAGYGIEARGKVVFDLKKIKDLCYGQIHVGLSKNGRNVGSANTRDGEEDHHFFQVFLILGVTFDGKEHTGRHHKKSDDKKHFSGCCCCTGVFIT